MMTVAKLAKETQVNSDTIRYYVRIGLLTPGREKNNNYHVFSKQDANQLKFIHHAKQLGYTLKEIQQIIEQSISGNSPCPIVRQIKPYTRNPAEAKRVAGTPTTHGSRIATME